MARTFVKQAGKHAIKTRIQASTKSINSAINQARDQASARSIKRAIKQVRDQVSARSIKRVTKQAHEQANALSSKRTIKHSCNQLNQAHAILSMHNCTWNHARTVLRIKKSFMS
jgi:hypothetical protein